MKITTEVLNLDLPPKSYIVVGSGIMSALNIRESNDIDLIVSENVFEILRVQGWEEGAWVDQQVLKKGLFDVGKSWSGKSVEDLLQSSTVIDGVPYLSLTDLRKWKVEHGRPKDLNDIALIDDYLAIQ